jgi:hypothetical protein
MRVQPLALRAVLDVAERMRESDRREVYAMCWPGADTPEALAMEVMRVSRFGATIHTADGQAQAALGLAPVLPGVFSAWMFATDRWREVWRTAARHARDVMRPTAEAAGMWRAQCHSAADHPDAHAFLRWVGFRAEGVPVPLGRGREMFIPFGLVVR